MDKCSSFLADTCTKKLIGLLESIGSSIEDKSVYKNTLKYHILNDPFISIEIESNQSFSIFENSAGTIATNSKAIAEARIADYLLGVARVRRQYKDLLQLKSSNINNAWLLVSTYYCAYFACVELGKLFDRIPLSFDSSDIQIFKNKATGSAYSQFFDNISGNYNFSGTIRADKLVFNSIGKKPHVVAWDNLIYILKKVFKGKDWLEAKYYISILEKDELSPSVIRNIWNYKRSDYFGTTGDKIGAEFRKLVSNNVGANNWMVKKQNHIEDYDPCIIPVLCELVATSIIESKERILNILV